MGASKPIKNRKRKQSQKRDRGRGRRWPACAIAAVGLLAIGWGAYRAAVGWRFEAELSRAVAEVSSGQIDPARERLGRLLGYRGAESEVAYHLGLCEEAAGRPGAAMMAWNRIAPESPYASLAAQHRDVLLRRYHDEGRFAQLEELLDIVRQADGPEAVEAGQSLARLLRFECRFDELRKVLREEWARSSDPYRTLHELWLLDVDPVPIEMVRGVLDQAAARAPGDDRVWLGKANLAIWSGQFEEADRWIRACLDRRPRDPAAWRARLDWAMATDRPDEARRALEHLTSQVFPPERVLMLCAWLAARDPRLGDLETRLDRESRALDALIASAPSESAALERRIELAVIRGDLDRAAGLRRAKSELDRNHHRYGNLLREGNPEANLPELADLAESLGRGFEAKAYWTLMLERRPNDSRARRALVRIDRKTAAVDATSVPRSPEQLLSELTLAGKEAESPPPGPARSQSLPESRLAFVDSTHSAGLEFSFDNGQSPARQLPETMSGGLGLIDYDGDGWFDVYVVQGGPFPPGPGGTGSGDRLFRNRGDGTFEDVTEPAGIAGFAKGYGHGVAVADYDNDGHPDLFVTRWRSYALYRNDGDGTFSDVTDRAGLGGDRDWPTSAAFADLDGDGDPDLYVCHYLDWDSSNPRTCPPNQAGNPTYCDPREFEARADRLYRNDGGRFVDVTKEAGISAPDGRGLGVVAADLDGDGLVDLYVANDTTANFFYRNLGAMRFDEVAHESGLAGNAEGGYQAGMGIAIGDFGGDGRPDLAVTNFIGEGTTYYHNLGDGMFIDRSADIGVSSASRRWLGFGIVCLDADNDGWLDLATANGHVNDYRPTFPFAMPAQILQGGRAGRLTDVGAVAGRPWQIPRVGRGLAAGDLDNDGRMDLVLLSHDQPLAYLQNQTEGGHFVTFRLEGTRSNRDAIGARVTLRTRSRDQVGYRFGGGSYQSASDPRLHFGLGEADRLDSVEVAWPSGHEDRFSDLRVDSGYLLREGSPQAFPLPGF
jgi:tetratricopeptide (TPR) repeat protein